MLARLSTLFNNNQLSLYVVYTVPPESIKAIVPTPTHTTPTGLPICSYMLHMTLNRPTHYSLVSVVSVYIIIIISSSWTFHLADKRSILHLTVHGFYSCNFMFFNTTVCLIIIKAWVCMTFALPPFCSVSFLTYVLPWLIFSILEIIFCLFHIVILGNIQQFIYGNLVCKGLKCNLIWLKKYYCLL